MEYHALRRVSRRRFLGWGAAAAAAGLSARGLAAGTSAAASSDEPYRFALRPLGKVKPRRPVEIKGSPLSVGFETLDRRHFDPEKAYPRLAQLGAKWARCQTGWCRCETARGQYDFQWLDDIVDSLSKIGVQPWFSISYGNELYTPGAGEVTGVGWVPLFTEEARQGWVNYTRAIARHFCDRVKCWEIWNEPNISNFWKPAKPKAEDYAALVALTAPEIRRAVPDAVIVGGALAGVAEPYLRDCLKAGLAEHVDKISYHPYRAVPEAGYAKQIRALRDLIGQYDKTIRLWQGENGCPSKGGEDSTGALATLDWNETRQAKWLLRRVLSDLANNVELVSYFHCVDLVGYRGKTNFKGLLRGGDYSPKPAFFAYQRLCALFDSETAHRVDLKLDLVDQEERLLETAGFVRDGRAIHAYWFPANLQQGWNPRTITLRAAAPPGATLREPVLVDPLSGTVYSLPPAEKTDTALTFKDLPLLDYPLLIADRAVALA